jgi:chaperonin GroES
LKNDKKPDGKQEEYMKLRPLFDKIVLEPVKNEEVTKGGIILPSAAQEKQQMGTIIAVGDGGIVDGKEIAIKVKVGEKVIYANYAGSEFKLDGKEYVIIRQSDILAVLD